MFAGPWIASTIGSQAIESINQASIQSVSGTRQVEQEVKNLQDLVFQLKRLVSSRAMK